MRYYYSLLLALFFGLLSSCTTSQLVSIEGIPGTEIYSPNKEKLGVIDETGKAKVELSSENYYAYLLSRQPNATQHVPFALDYEYNSYWGTKTLQYTGIGLVFGGLYAEFMGLIMLAAGAEDLAITCATAGLAVALPGSAIGGPADSRASQTQYKYQYKYMPQNSTNEDLRFVSITDNGIKKTSLSPDIKTKVKDSTTSNSKESTVHINASSSSRALRNYAKSVSGTYIGNGSLRKDGEIIERYERIQIVVNRIDNISIEVNVIENGESFFNEKLNYTVKKADAGYEMFLKDIPNACMNLNVVGVLSYIHPLVNIGGEIYTLEISAQKQ